MIHGSLLNIAVDILHLKIQKEKFQSAMESNGEETLVLTVLHKSKEPVKFFGTVIGETTATLGGWRKVKISTLLLSP